MLTKELNCVLNALEELHGQSSGSDWALMDCVRVILTELGDNEAALPAELVERISAASGGFQVAQRNAKSR